MGRLFDAAIAVGVVVIFSGCASSDPSIGPSYANPTTVPVKSRGGQVRLPPPTHFRLPEMPDTTRCVVAPALQRIISVEKVGMLKRNGGSLQIEVKIKNLTDAPQHFLYHLEWFDIDGKKLAVDDDGYQPWLLVDKEIAYIAVTAPTQIAEDFGIAFVPAN